MNLDYAKYADGLIPAIIQDAETQSVLMLGFMNADALEKTLSTGNVAFFSRTRGRLWTKGETSGNFLKVVAITPDCDNDTLLITARPVGPVCHTGEDTCFGPLNRNEAPYTLLAELQDIIDHRRSADVSESYVAKLFGKGINKIAQKVGEEAVELVIESKDDDKEKFVSEAADLLFHYLILLRAKDTFLDDVLEVLKDRRK